MLKGIAFVAVTLFKKSFIEVIVQPLSRSAFRHRFSLLAHIIHDETRFWL
jgi:hypothetical protein